MIKTITKADLVKAIYTNVGISSAEAGRLVASMFEEIVEALKKGDCVNISNFGSFYTKMKSARVGRNPKTFESFEIAPRNVVSFYPANLLKYRINK